MKPKELNKMAVIYCRVSTEDQAATGISIESQEKICTEAIVKDGYELFEVIKDEGRSGGNLKRPGIQRLIELVINKQINAVYTVHSDRLARNTIDHLSLIDLFRKNAISLKCTQQPDMGDDATSKMMGTMLASINEFYRNISSEKTTSTMGQKAKAGYYPSMAPVGYKNTLNSDTSLPHMAQKIVTIDPETAPLVKNAFKMYATGNFNIYELNDIMFAKGLKTRHGLRRSDSHFYEMLKNRFYIGEVHWGKTHVINGKHEPLVSQELFDQVQRVLASKNKHACRRRKFTWLLTGFLRCYTHACRFTAEWHLNKSKAYYHCTNRNGCGKYIEIGKLENMVADKFKALEFSKSFIDIVISKARTIFYERRKVYDTKRKECINQRTAYESKRKFAEEKLFSKVISDDDFTRIRAEIEQEIQNIDGRLAELEKQRNVNVDIAQEILNLTRNIYDTYEKASPALKRQYLGFFWERFEVTDGLIIKSVPSLLFAELLKLEQAYQKSKNTEKSIVSKQVIKSNEWCPEQEIVITIFSDRDYMQGLYNRLLFIKAMRAT